MAENKNEQTKQIFSKFIFNDMCAVYLKDNKTDCIGLTLLPAGMEKDINLEGWWNIEPAVQLKLAGDSYSDGWASGHSMKNNGTSAAMKFLGQHCETSANATGAKTTKVITEYQIRSVLIQHILQYTDGNIHLISYSKLTNNGTAQETIEMLSSFNLCAFPCIGKGLRQHELILHRMQSKWSMEGKLESRTFLDMNLEPAWLRIGATSERFGQVGSMPVRRYFPWMIVEDTKYNYSIGAQLAHPASWQMEVYNKDEKNSISGGLADREFGHWTKNLQPQNSFQTPYAILTAAKLDVDGISHRLTSAQQKNLDTLPKSESELPIIFNEYCTTWGNPTQENMTRIAEKLKNHGITYCVIDAGWHVKDGNDWSDIGDWITNKTRFPDGLKATADKIKQCGMIPGIWFEMENCGAASQIFNNTQMLLTRDGYPIQCGSRRFLDMRKPEVINYLRERVINTLRDNDFGYLKVDYNDTIGLGCDGAESLGEGLRQNMAATQSFFKELRQELPDLVIENCSSGGHRLEPSMQALTSMASFSDAHEWQTIPVIAANVTRAILPAQSQIWAVLRKTDDDKRLHYSLTNTFLGRMCLSGDIYDLSAEQWKTVDEAIGLYKRCNHLISLGRNYRSGPFQKSYNDLNGWQAVTRVSLGKSQMMTVINTFANFKGTLKISLPENAATYSISQVFARPNIKVAIKQNCLVIKNAQDFEGIVVLMEN